jgi:hypothetical protein
MSLFFWLSTTVPQRSVHTSHSERCAYPIPSAPAETTTTYTTRAQPFAHEDGWPGDGDQLFAALPAATGGGRCSGSHHGPRRPKHERAGVSHGGGNPPHGGWCPSSDGGPVHVHSPASARTTYIRAHTRARGPGTNRGASGAGGGSPPSARGDGSAATAAPHRDRATAGTGGTFGNFSTAATAITGPDSGPVTSAHISVTSAASGAGSSNHAANALTGCTSSSLGNHHCNVEDGAGSQPDCRIRPGCKSGTIETSLSERNDRPSCKDWW